MILLALGLAAFLPVAGTKLAAQPPATVSTNSQAKPATPAEPSLEEKLNRRIDIDFEETPLNQAMDFLSETYGVQILVSVKKLEEAGIQADTPVTKRLKQIPMKTVLDLMLDELELTYMAKDDLIFITTPEHAESQLEVRVYDCRDLLAMREPGEAAIPGANEAAPPDAASGPAGSSDPFGPDGAPGPGASERKSPPMTAHERRAARFMNIIMTNVDAQAWDQVGGPGAISEFNGLIVVTQTGNTHKKVEDILEMLREAANLEAPRSDKVVR